MYSIPSFSPSWLVKWIRKRQNSALSLNIDERNGSVWKLNTVCLVEWCVPFPTYIKIQRKKKKHCDPAAVLLLVQNFIVFVSNQVKIDHIQKWRRKFRSIKLDRYCCLPGIYHRTNERLYLFVSRLGLSIQMGEPE